MVETVSLSLSEPTNTSDSGNTTGSSGSFHVLDEDTPSALASSEASIKLTTSSDKDADSGADMTTPNSEAAVESGTDENSSLEGNGSASDVASLVEQTEVLSLDTNSPTVKRPNTLPTQQAQAAKDSKPGVAPDAFKPNGLHRRNGYNHSRLPRYQNYRPPLLNGFPPHTAIGSHPLQLSPLYHSSYPLLSAPPSYHGPIAYNPSAPPPQSIQPPHPHYSGPAPTPTLTFTPPVSPVQGAM